MGKTLIENLEAAKKPYSPIWNAALDEAVAIVRRQRSEWPPNEEQAEIVKLLPASILGREMSPSDMFTDIYSALMEKYLIIPR